MSELSIAHPKPDNNAPPESNRNSPKPDKKDPSESDKNTPPIDGEELECAWPVHEPLLVYDKEQLEKALKWLEDISYIEINKIAEHSQVACCCEQAFKYNICNKEGEPIAGAEEHSRRSCCGFPCRRCCLKNRGFAIMIKSVEYGDSFFCQRWYNPCKGCFPPCCGCTNDQMFINALDGKVLANCIEPCTFFTPRYTVMDADDNIKFKVKGPCCRCCKNITFTVIDRDGAEVGTIYKKWGGYVAGMVENTDTIVAEFSQFMEVNLKAAIIGMTFLIDFMYFEDGFAKKKKKRAGKKANAQNPTKSENQPKAENK